jgi:hypothetical protein
MCCELGPEFAERAGRVAKELGECRTDAALRARPFKDDGIEDFDLIELVAFALEELPPLFDGGFNDRVVVPCKRYIGAIRFEEVLVDVKAGAECFERGFQAFDRVLLFRMVKAFVVHAGNAENHAHIATLGEEGRLIPEAVQIDVVVERRALLPRLDDFIESKHQRTSTRGTCCLAAS